MRLEQSPADGTFLFPPDQFESVEAYLKFWSTAPVSDGVLANILAGYAELIRAQAQLESSNWGNRYDAAHRRELTAGSQAGIAAAQERREQAYNEHMAGWYKEHPPKIKNSAARAIARAAQGFYFRTLFKTDDEREKVANSTVDVDGETMTFRQVRERYQTDALRPYFTDPDVMASERLEDVRRELRILQGGIRT